MTNQNKVNPLDVELAKSLFIHGQLIADDGLTPEELDWSLDQIKIWLNDGYDFDITQLRCKHSGKKLLQLTLQDLQPLMIACQFDKIKIQERLDILRANHSPSIGWLSLTPDCLLHIAHKLPEQFFAYQLKELVRKQYVTGKDINNILLVNDFYHAMEVLETAPDWQTTDAATMVELRELNALLLNALAVGWSVSDHIVDLAEMVVSHGFAGLAANLKKDFKKYLANAVKSGRLSGSMSIGERIASLIHDNQKSHKVLRAVKLQKRHSNASQEKILAQELFDLAISEGEMFILQHKNMKQELQESKQRVKLLHLGLLHKPESTLGNIAMTSEQLKAATAENLKSLFAKKD